MRIGLFGGSFDPIHLGHLLAASEAAQALELDRVLFVTAARPPHKTPLAPAETRHDMVVLATLHDPRFVASRLELDRAGPSYTIHTLREAKAQFPSDQLFFITGADAYREVDTWHMVEQMPALASFVGVTRPGYTAQLHPFFAEHTRLLPIPGFEVSSTLIRSRIKAGHTLRYLVPFEVEVYLDKYQPYPRPKR